MWVASSGGAMGHRPEGAVRKRSTIKLEFLRKTTHTRSPCDRTHHSHARCARSHRPNASSGPREWCFGRFASPRLVSAQAQVHFTNSSRVEVVLWSRDTYERSVRLNSGVMEHNLRRSARATYLVSACGSPTHRVLSHGAAMVGELRRRARVCGRAAGERRAASRRQPAHGRDRVLWQRCQRFNAIKVPRGVSEMRH